MISRTSSRFFSIASQTGISPGEYDRDLFRIQIYTNGATAEAHGPDDARTVESLKKEVQEYAVAEVRKRLEKN